MELSYNPKFLFKNGHFNTIYPTLFRKQKQPRYRRERLVTPDDDFLDIDTIFNNNGRLAILCHGLEGSSTSKYIIGASQLLSDNQWDTAAVNYRSCSGEMNKQLRMYHSGATDDLALIVDHYKDRYESIALIGYSLGGNLSLKYGAEDRIRPLNLKQIIAVSVPVDLKAGSVNIGKPSNFIYTKKFLITLTEKVKLKQNQFPNEIDLSKLNLVKSLYDFDNYFTGPVHGFEDADDYYEKCSSKPLIPKLSIPTTIINALDDPFLPEECYPYEEVEQNEKVQLMTPPFGGHVGFTQFRSEFYWIEKQILSIINNSC